MARSLRKGVPVEAGDVLAKSGANTSPPQFASHLMQHSELSILENHTQTMRLVVANLVAAREQLETLPSDPRRDRLLQLQYQVIDAANAALAFSDAALTHVQSVENF